MEAEIAGIKLELVQGNPTWEFSPSIRHQNFLDRIRQTIRATDGPSNPCGCHSVHDAYFRFPDGSLKRPDISIFFAEPPDTDVASEVLPDAVVEIVSRGFEKKDLEIGPPFYLMHGIKDVVVVNPINGLVHHFTQSGVVVTSSPCTIQLSIGCALDA